MSKPSIAFCLGCMPDFFCPKHHIAKYVIQNSVCWYPFSLRIVEYRAPTYPSHPPGLAAGDPPGDLRGPRGVPEPVDVAAAAGHRVRDPSRAVPDRAPTHLPAPESRVSTGCFSLTRDSRAKIHNRQLLYKAQLSIGSETSFRSQRSRYFQASQGSHAINPFAFVSWPRSSVERGPRRNGALSGRCRTCCGWRGAPSVASGSTPRPPRRGDRAPVSVSARHTNSRFFKRWLAG